MSSWQPAPWPSKPWFVKICSQVAAIDEVLRSILKNWQAVQLRNLIRRQKWRLRPLKRFVLPWRRLRRTVLAFLRPFVPGLPEPPTIAKSTIDYRGPSKIATHEIFPAERVQPRAHPFERSDAAPTTAEPAYLFELSDIDFRGRYGGSVVTADDKLLADLSPEVWGVENHPIFSQLRPPKSQRLTARTAIAVTPEAPANYYHWIIDLLPRLALIKSATGSVDSFAQILVNGSRASYEQASMNALGVPGDKIRYVDANDRFQIENATIPSMDHFSKTIAPWKIKFLRALRESNPARSRISSKRIYISRRRAAVRRVLNEKDFERILRDAGFVLIEIESLSWPEQVALFSNAEVVLAPHGAALVNAAFCEPETLIAEIGTRAGYKEFYLRLAASTGLRYRFVEAALRVAPRDSSKRALENEDMIVDPKTVRDFLSEL
jgi:capsular polysaccharide biosynthesis protein